MTQDKQHPPLPENVKAALHEILDYSWWSEALDWVENEGENRPGFDEHVYPALKLIADWIGWTAYQYNPQWTPEMGTPSNIRLTKNAQWEPEE